MLAWLADKDPDVRHAIAQCLNWDSSVPVLAWITSREDCDAATAASIVWLGEPQYYADARRSGRALVPSEEWDLLQAVLRRFRAGVYVRSELAPFPGLEHLPARYRAWQQDLPDPLDLPDALFEPPRGRPPRLPPDCDPRQSALVWDLLAALGSYMGRRPTPSSAH